MSRTAYLVVHLDTADQHHPPVVAGAGIYSEPAQSLTGACGQGKWAFDVIDTMGDDYEDACRKVREYLKNNDFVFGWVLRLLDEVDQ